MNKNRTCRVCNEFKSIDNFQPQGLQCKDCRNEKRKIYWSKLSPEEKNRRMKNGEYQRRYRELYPEKVKENARRTHIKRKFNITVEEYDAMAVSQNNVCATCKQECATGNNLAVDHNHTTGKIRGLLCKNCNTALGLLKEDTNTMINLIEYVKFHNLVETV